MGDLGLEKVSFHDNGEMTTVATNDSCVREFFQPHATARKHDQSLSQGIYSAWQDSCRKAEEVWSQAAACALNLELPPLGRTGSPKKGGFRDRDEIPTASCPELHRWLRTNGTVLTCLAKRMNFSTLGRVRTLCTMLLLHGQLTSLKLMPTLMPKKLWIPDGIGLLTRNDSTSSQ